MSTVQANRKRHLSPLLYPAALLSLASLAWTTWSLVDLLGTGLIGVTVAAGADIIWGSVILAEARGLRIAGKSWIVPTFGWASLLVVAGFLAWHGIAQNAPAMAAAGPFLPLGAKAVWVLALADMRDPAALTDNEKHQLARMERGMAFEEAQHRIEMRRREMNAERQMAEVSSDFDIEMMRQDKARELNRRKPLELPPHDAQRITPRRTSEHHTSDTPAALTAASPHHTTTRITPHRTDTANELPDETSDTPPLRPVPATAAAPQIDDASLHLDGLSKAAAVRAVRDAHPTASAPQIAQRLAHHGIDATDAYVRTVLSRIRAQRATPDGGYL